MLTQEILDQKYEQIKTQAQASGLNPYDYFINSIRNSTDRDVVAQNNPMEKHHIIPKHAGGHLTDPSNLINLTVEEHLLAHWVRWRTFNEHYDFLACLFRFGDAKSIDEARRLAVAEARARDKQNKRGRYSSEQQAAWGRRGGPKGGSRNTSAQFEARRNVGLCFGRTIGLKNQGVILKQNISCYSVWCFKSDRESFYYLVPPHESAAELIETLDYFEPGTIKKAENGHWSPSFYKVIKGERPSMYGWTCVSRLISSKVKDGTDKNNQFNGEVPEGETAEDIAQFIENFNKQYPKAYLKIEI